jgi:hypothetical protein
MAFPNAYLGFVGWVRFGSSYFVRATSADIGVTQSIEKPDVVDGKIDKTVYQLGPVEVGGSVSFPGVYELYPGTTKSPLVQLWNWAIQRTDGGDIVPANKQDIFIKYVNGVGFRYTKTVIDSYEFNIAAEDVLNITVNVIGVDRQQDTDPSINNNLPDYSQRNTRIITWNDVDVSIGGPGVSVESAEIRSFTATVANNVQRIYTLNSSLAPTVVVPTKRDITGSFTLIGRNSSLGLRAYGYEGESATGNETRCTADNTIGFGYSTQLGENANCASEWGVEFADCVVFEVEEMAITNDFFETTVNWHALPGVRYVSEPGDASENFCVTGCN